MIDFERKVVFVHVPRTGGTSIEAAFGLIEQSRKIHHFTATENEKLLKKKGENPEDYYWFSFVRNPWDRVISAYFQKTNRHIGQMYGHSLEHFLSQWNGISGKSEHSRTQLGYLDNDLVNVFYFEHRTKVLTYLGQKFDMDFLSFHKRGSKRKTGYHQYFTKETRNIVAEMFREDIEYFGYTY